jgi:hypothetical protein
VDPVNEEYLKSQAEFFLADIDALSRLLSSDTVDASVSRLQTLRQSLDKVRMTAAPTMVPQTTPQSSRGQQSAPSSKPVKPSGEPPTEEEIAAMERAVEFTYRSGPPLKETEGSGDDGAMSIRVQQAMTNALAFLDQAEEAMHVDDLDAAQVALAQAEEAIKGLYTSMP